MRNLEERFSDYYSERFGDYYDYHERLSEFDERFRNFGSTCCDKVVDPISLIVTLAAITAVSLFLRQAVIDNNIMMAKKRRKRDDFIILLGNYVEI